MRNLACKTVRCLAEETRGAEIAEAAAVLPLMFMFLLGIFWFGQAFSIYGTITRAAQEGARAGAAPYCSTCTAANRASVNAFNAVQAALVIDKLDPANARYPRPVPTLLKCTDGTSVVNCDLAASGNVCVQPTVQLSTGSGAAGVCGLSVSFQYPFQFWLPFTSLNQQQIWLTASARVRSETQ
jgi:Flp pilus assembly protein TadG